MGCHIWYSEEEPGRAAHRKQKYSTSKYEYLKFKYKHTIRVLVVQTNKQTNEQDSIIA